MLTALAKIISAFGTAPVLSSTDPILKLTFRHLILEVGILELIVSVICFYTTKRGVSIALLVWISTNFLIYRVGLWSIGWHQPCTCLGDLTGAINISRETADLIMKAVLAYLLVGSYLSLALMLQSFTDDK